MTIIDISPLPMAEQGETRVMSWGNPKAYELSKVASETIAGQIAQWSGTPFIALRFSNIMAPADYQDFPSFWGDPRRP